MSVKIVECPRDAMQGWPHTIATSTKIDYLKLLLNVGCDTLDCGSFVSSKAVPQLADSKEVVEAIAPFKQSTKLLTIVANTQGAKMASAIEAVDVIGFPFSISETFQIRNTKQTIAEAIETLKYLLDISVKHNKQVQVYLSMCFGNPYKDIWSTDMVLDWCHRLKHLGVQMINLSDTIGVATTKDIAYVFDQVNALNGMEFGAHFHTTYMNAEQHVEAAFRHGCRKFDAAIKGFGGCPFASDQLTGNLPTELLIAYLNELNETSTINSSAFALAMAKAQEVFVTL
jgi:hydroxymethylglutaryl-CoA lyase